MMLLLRRGEQGTHERPLRGEARNLSREATFKGVVDPNAVVSAIDVDGAFTPNVASGEEPCRCGDRKVRSLQPSWKAWCFACVGV